MGRREEDEGLYDLVIIYIMMIQMKCEVFLNMEAKVFTKTSKISSVSSMFEIDQLPSQHDFKA